MDRAETEVLLIQKTDTEGYRWWDQVALPGGRIDEQDRSATDAARREVREELGIDHRDINILGTLGHFQTRQSDNDLEVVVGHWTRRSTLNVDQREISRVLEVPLNDLVELHLREGFRSRPVSDVGDALAYELCDARIWGVTARVLHHFLGLLLDHEAMLTS